MKKFLFFVALVTVIIILWSTNGNPATPHRLTQTSRLVYKAEHAPTVLTGIMCVVTIDGTDGIGTFSPGPAVNGDCSSYGYPGAVAVPYTVLTDVGT